MVLAPIPVAPATRAIGHEPVLVLDTRLRVRALNRAAEELTGTRGASHRGRPAQAVIDVQLTSGRPAFDLHAQAIRMVAAGWAPPPETVRVNGELRLLSLIAIDHDGERLLIATIRPQPAVEASENGVLPAPRLTERQREVLVSIADGRRCSETAHVLGVSPTTVRHHIRSILSAFGVHSQLAAVAEARRAGIV